MQDLHSEDQEPELEVEHRQLVDAPFSAKEEVDSAMLEVDQEREVMAWLEEPVLVLEEEELASEDGQSLAREETA